MCHTLYCATQSERSALAQLSPVTTMRAATTGGGVGKIGDTVAVWLCTFTPVWLSAGPV